MKTLRTKAEADAQEKEQQRKLTLIDDSAGYMQRELIRTGAIGPDSDPFADLRSADLPGLRSSVRDDMYTQQTDETAFRARSPRRVLLDTNVLLDHLLLREDRVEQATTMLKTCVRHDVALCRADTSLKDIAYISAMVLKRRCNNNKSPEPGASERTPLEVSTHPTHPTALHRTDTRVMRYRRHRPDDL